MVRLIGLDPGIAGACALYVPDDPGQEPDSIFDIPTIGDGNKKEIHYAELRNRIWALKPDIAFIEQVNAFMPTKKNKETGEDEGYVVRAYFLVGDIRERLVEHAEAESANDRHQRHN